MAIFLLVLACVSVQAETLRKRYTLDFDRATRRASEKKVEATARKRFIRDFLAEKFSKEIIDNLAEEIDIALDPPEDYLISFETVGSPKFNDDETQITITVEGDVDTPAMVSALVLNKVLSFGEQPLRVMFMPSSRFDSSEAAKKLRARLFEKMTQAGIQPVAFEGSTETFYSQLKGKITANSAEFKSIQKVIKQYNADYLVYIDPEVSNQPASIGGYICDASFIYTIMRPNNNLILGEGALPPVRASSSSAMLAFNKVLDQVASDLINQSLGQLYRSIFSDSQVIYSTQQLRNNITVTIYEAKSGQVDKIIELLKAQGASVRLGAGTPISSRIEVETSMDTLELFNFFNSQSYTAGAVKFSTPVVGYTENSIDIEVAEASRPTKRPKPAKPPTPKTKPTSESGSNTGQNPTLVSKSKPLTQSELKSRTKPSLVLKPLQYNR